jgi:hypothetical protein
VNGNDRGGCILRLAIYLAWLVVRHREACGRGDWVVCGCSGERRRKKKDEGKQAGSQKMTKRCHSRKECRSRCHVLGSSASRAVERRMASREAVHSSDGETRSCDLDGEIVIRGTRRCSPMSCSDSSVRHQYWQINTEFSPYDKVIL